MMLSSEYYWAVVTVIRFGLMVELLLGWMVTWLVDKWDVVWGLRLHVGNVCHFGIQMFDGVGIMFCYSVDL